MFYYTVPVDAMLAQATAEHESSSHSGAAGADTQSVTSHGSSSHHSDTTFDSSGMLSQVMCGKRFMQHITQH